MFSFKLCVFRADGSAEWLCVDLSPSGEPSAPYQVRERLFACMLVASAFYACVHTTHNTLCTGPCFHVTLYLRNPCRCRGPHDTTHINLWSLTHDASASIKQFRYYMHPNTCRQTCDKLCTQFVLSIREGRLYGEGSDSMGTFTVCEATLNRTLQWMAGSCVDDDDHAMYGGGFVEEKQFLVCACVSACPSILSVYLFVCLSVCVCVCMQYSTSPCSLSFFQICFS
jgi:hypothetical protein